MTEKRFWIFLVFVVVGGLGFVFFRYPHQRKADLVIYTYSSFASQWGPSPVLKKAFEEKYHYTVEFVDAGEAALFLEKLKRDQPKQIDLVLGLDQWLLDKAAHEQPWREIHLPEGASLPPSLKGGDLKYFLPFDWAPMAFNYKASRVKNPPKSLDDLLDKRFYKSIALEDPRTSTPGLQFLYWVALEKGDHAEEYLKKLKASVHSVSPSWSMAYGLFKKDQASLVFSYATSPAYHWKNDHDKDFQIAVFKHPHPVQVEWLGIPSNCNSCNTAELFVQFLLTGQAQADLMNFNFMFPLNSDLIKNTVFQDLPQVPTYPLEKYGPVNLEALMTKWKSAF